VGVSSLRECVAVLRGEEPPEEPVLPPLHEDAPRADPTARVCDDADLSDVRGQHQARRCVEVAAAGGHHLFMKGPPGAGKTMLAERFPALLPALGVEHSIEVSTIHSVAGLLSRDDPRVTRPPYLAPNHTDTIPSVIGGGTRVIRPGAISLAHHGVLFMDEAPEFKPTVHDALRQPLESGVISIRRANDAARFPACFQLILAANPCPCGHSSGKSRDCECTPSAKRRYRDRISGPVRDRIDITHTVLPVSRAEMRQQVGATSSTNAVAQRVATAREQAGARFAGMPWLTNAEVPGYEFRRRCPLPPEASAPIESAVGDGELTQRGADRAVRLAWTIADLGGRPAPDIADVLEAMHLRTDGVRGHSLAVGSPA
ncbi:MAG: YifB family Mg chelatase-like AAA ATPase, partial [Nocardioidaceae bacterium]